MMLRAVYALISRWRGIGNRQPPHSHISCLPCLINLRRTLCSRAMARSVVNRTAFFTLISLVRLALTRQSA